MRTPDWGRLVFIVGVLPEPIAEEDRILAWLPVSRDGGFQYWERVGNLARAEITTDHGVCSTAATSIQARQRVGVVGKLLGGFQKATKERALTLPNGESAERWGERRTDLLLAWTDDETHPLDESRIKARWPGCREVRQIGPDLFLVSGIEARVAANEPIVTTGTPQERAERFLAAARQSGDLPGEVLALTDLGVVCQKSGDLPRAVGILEEALAKARPLGDPSKVCEVIGNLGLAMLDVGQPGRALGLFEDGLATARAAGDGCAEKLGLERVGLAHASLGDPSRALGFYGQALAGARALGDRQHEINLLWHLGIQHATLGQRAEAIATAQEAIDLLAAHKKPQAEWFAEHLRRYRRGDSGVIPGMAGGSGPRSLMGGTFDFGGSIVVSGMADPSHDPSPQAPSAGGPSLLSMAFSAAQSMAKFLGSGFKIAPSETLQNRLRICRTCEHHTGLRCRVCGCFTDAKARLLHEDCPLGKW